MEQVNSPLTSNVERIADIDGGFVWNLYRNDEFIFFFADDIRCLLPIRGKDNLPIIGIDFENFHHIGGRFFRDKQRIYIRPERTGTWGVYELNSGNIQVLNHWYAFDNKYLYSSMYGKRRAIKGKLRIPPGKGYYAIDDEYAYINSTRITGSQADSFIGLEEGYARDAEHIYFRGKLLKEADPETFISFDFNEKDGLAFDAIDKRHGYSLGKIQRNSGYIYDLERFFSRHPHYEHIYPWLSKAVANTENEQIWQILPDGFAVSSVSVYWMKPPYPKITSELQNDKKAQEAVWYQHEDKYQPLIDIDPAKFIYLEQGYYVHDTLLYWRNLEVYYLDIIELKRVNPESFTCIGGEYFSDGEKVICCGKVLRGVQPNNLKMYSNYLMTDGKGLYYRGRQLKKLSLDGFEYLGNDYFSISGQLYRHDRELKNVKSQLVHQHNIRFLTSDCIILDNGRVIYCNLLLNKSIDAETLIIFNRYFAKDKKHVYFIGVDDRFKTIEGAAPESFTAPSDEYDFKEQQIGRDKAHIFHWKELIPSY